MPVKCSAVQNKPSSLAKYGWEKLAYSTVAVFSLMLMVLLAACSDDGQNTANMSQGGIQRLSRASGKVDGAILVLAKELIESNVNPFLNKLPITVDAQAEAQPPEPIGGQEPAQVPVDPFASVTLVGISYQAKNSYALVSLSSDSAAQVVREGDLVTTDSGAQLKIGKIQQTRVDIRELSGSTGRSLTLPDIIGFTKDPSAGAQSPSIGGGLGKGAGIGGRGGNANTLPLKDTDSSMENKSPIINLED